MVDDNSRDRGILNERQREYLRGDSDIEPKSATERKIRQSIRQQLRDAILDFPVLLEHMEKRDLEGGVFDPGPELKSLHDSDESEIPYDHFSYDEVSAAIPDAVGVLYLDDPEVFETRVINGVSAAERRHGWDAHVDVNIDVERKSIDDLAKKVAAEGINTDATVRDLNVLLAAGEVAPELYGRIIEKRLEEEAISEGVALMGVGDNV